MPHPNPLIACVAVLGAGTMGSRIAAHIANAGLPVILLDIVLPDKPRNFLALSALDALRKAKPAAFYTPDAARLITPGNFEDDLALLKDCDWIIEAVAENLEIKRALIARVAEHRKPGSILTTNTSGLPIASIVEGFPEDLRAHWFGTHFFNPPRYMRLLEIIPTAESSPEAVDTIATFCDKRLGKTVVPSRDTPNFIANRVGTFSMLNAIRLMQEQGLTIEEIDALTGAPLGFPKTGTFRLGDLVGVDVLAHVATNFAAQSARTHDERADVVLPPFITHMLEQKWLGDKTQQGFYKKAGRDEQGRDLRHVLDWQSLDYHPATRPKLAALEQAKPIEHLGTRIAQLLHADPKTDKAAAFYWPFLTELFTYAANRVSASDNEPAATIVEIDAAMKAGFNWELGPFEMMDAAGPRATTYRMLAENRPVSTNVERLLNYPHAITEPGPTWYKDDPTTPSGRQFFDPTTATYKPVPIPEGVSSLATLKKSHGVVKKNSGASLVDFGDGVAAIELHSKMNALGGDIVSFITQTLKPTSEAVANFTSFVITGESNNFSVGANLMQLLLAIQDEEWDDIALMVRGFQNMTQLIKFCPRPVVVAPYGMCLGGGVEISLHAAARQPHAELYMGLVEAGVGLIPGGGGCKEMLLRTIESGTSIRPDARGEGVEIFESLKKNFETIAKATVSTSAAEARTIGFLRPSDAITMNRDRLLTDAKLRAQSLTAAGYTAPSPQLAVPAPGTNALATLKLAVWTLREGQYISAHDAKVANWAAYALCGGNVTPGTPVTEQYLLDLEREAFLSLCGEKKTQERIAFTLKTGKPLRN
ncbi:3-hydroxyacyl-CoA dehydrogenase/enoyl-CoA hydratase family protein [Granulicella tundricola]|uniref:3-hydroxyacyl-CoA dehydrogenase NAD-binding protein n=1 Tax=Granulicella tundricola (strain ATCC BAA-1859 / DSM 23138 / MP5ACTX9) TaxID=1198114 RepID=E8X2G3_GRATM|nr:3-hydroxyacyl-CoA dehydrogenase/enoyl-CoA hydratase family protein [Granulicella tundricola]ADW69187.1 3-hydroxyacyl-CoA dehydrogenase NAD-binding protein [Granulicella tundricola MP5ACTX9]